MLLIPGTSSVAHLRDNVASAGFALPEDAVAELGRHRRGLTTRGRAGQEARCGPAPRLLADSWSGHRPGPVGARKRRRASSADAAGDTGHG